MAFWLCNKLINYIKQTSFSVNLAPTFAELNAAAPTLDTTVAPTVLVVNLILLVVEENVVAKW
jgi:hypothetical protein